MAEIMVELFVEPIVSDLIKKLGPLALSFISSGGLHRKLKKWTNRLLAIQAVLVDAEDRQFNDKNIQLWLKDIQMLAFEIEDVVDDLLTEAGRRQMIATPESSRSGKLRKFFSGFKHKAKAIPFHYDLDRKIGKISDSLKDIEERINIMKLQKYVGGKSEKPGDQKLLSTSLVDATRVYGRDEESRAILKLLLEDKASDHDGQVRVISIVGMGGIGKTTLAQTLYNNEGVKDSFDNRAWVCVTEDFDVLKISKIIYVKVYNEGVKDDMDLDMVQEKLREKLSKKKFLLVLDDVWNQDWEKWDLLCKPFRYGAPGSTIIVTTRSQDVAKTMRSQEVYDLKVLSDGDCLSLLAQNAFERPNFDGHPDFKEVAEIIAKKCKGLPLAAMSLGGLLRTKGSLDQWVKVSISKIWDLQSNNSIPIIPALRLSYHHLPPHLKPLFEFCSLAPKGYEFNKQELILLWMSQGFLKQSSGEQEQMEELGSEYFDQLLSRSFFQLSTGNKSSYLMHDLNHDLAQFVTGLTYRCLDGKMVSNEQYNVSEETRHVSFICHPFADFKTFKKARCLRTILSTWELSDSEPSFLNQDGVFKDFPEFLCLRALSFTGYEIRKVPKSIGDLNHLRYLDFSRTYITGLPKSICDLYNLQTLLLHGCFELVQLPSNIHKLINLRHLDIGDTPSLEEMPLGIGLLTHLRTLSKFVIGNGDGQLITELEGLHCLQGTISIIGIEKVMNVQDATKANLSCNKEGLHGLEMNWSNNFGGTREGRLELEVLEALKPRTGLASLDIEFYGGQKFPSWVGDHSFCDMVKVSLYGCKNCTYLPPLGQLTSLKELVIGGMDGVKVVGPEFLGSCSPHIVAFQSLIYLSFEDMKGWEEWCVDENIGAFPSLQKLKVSECRKLKKVSLPKIPSLVSLDLRGCGEMTLRSMVGVGSVKLRIDDISGLSKLDEGIIECLGGVEDLTVSHCVDLRYLWEEEVACQILRKLKSLTVIVCKELELLGDEEQLLPHNLEILNLWDCDKLEKMPNWQNNLTSLRRLNIENCEKLIDSLVSTTYLEHKIEKHGESRGSYRRLGEYEFSNPVDVYIEQLGLKYGCGGVVRFGLRE